MFASVNKGEIFSIIASTSSKDAHMLLLSTRAPYLESCVGDCVCGYMKEITVGVCLDCIYVRLSKYIL